MGFFIPPIVFAAVVPPDFSEIDVNKPVRWKHIKELRDYIEEKLSDSTCQPRTIPSPWWSVPTPAQTESISGALVEEIRQTLSSAPFLPNNGASSIPPLAGGAAVSARQVQILWNAAIAGCGGGGAAPGTPCGYRTQYQGPYYPCSPNDSLCGEVNNCWDVCSREPKIETIGKETCCSGVTNDFVDYTCP